MGCCETRDDSGSSKKVTPSLNKTPKSATLNASDSINVNDKSSSSSVETKTIDPKHILKHIEFCKQNLNFQQLVDLISDKTEMESATARIAWADKPKTIGSLALVYLCQLIGEHWGEIVPILERNLVAIVHHIKGGTDDLRDNSLMLLYFFLDFASDESINILIQLGIFQLLMRSILCQKAELRHVTAAICYKLYKDRPYGKKLFMDLKGGKQLIQQILWSSDNDEILLSLLEYLIELLQDEDGQIIQEFVEILNEENALDIIRDINNSDKSTEALELMDCLISMLSNDE